MQKWSTRDEHCGARIERTMTHALPTDAEPLDCRCKWDEPSLDELLADEIMEPVMRSAHLDRAQLRRQLSEIALRVYVKTAGSAD